MLRNSLPTTNNLIQRNIIPPNVQLCAGGCGKIADIDHLFLSCDFFGHLWHGIFNWLGFITVPPEHVSNHFLQFENLGGFHKNIRLVFNLIWLACVWVVWSEINARVFRQQEDSLQTLLDKIKLQSYWWLKAKRINFASTYHMWWLNPLACLGIIL